MTNEDLLKYVKTNLRQLTDRFDENELLYEIDAIKEDIEDSTGKPFNINSAVQCAALVMGVKARFGSDDKQQIYEAQYQKDLSKLAVRRMGGAE